MFLIIEHMEMETVGNRCSGHWEKSIPKAYLKTPSTPAPSRIVRSNRSNAKFFRRPGTVQRTKRFVNTAKEGPWFRGGILEGSLRVLLETHRGKLFLVGLGELRCVRSLPASILCLECSCSRPVHIRVGHTAVMLRAGLEKGGS